MTEKTWQIPLSFWRHRKEYLCVSNKLYWTQMLKYTAFAWRHPEQTEAWVHPEVFLSMDVHLIHDSLKMSADPTDPILIVVVKDDIQRMQAFFPHYRRLGFHQFIIIDNMSSDGTLEYCSEQKNTRVYQVADKYATERKEAWVERVICMTGSNRWYGVADSDEFLNFVDSEEHQISDLIQKAQLLGHRGIRGILLDMYSENALFDQANGSSFLQEKRLFDSDGYTLYPVRKGIQKVLFGGPRVRALHCHEHMSKFPLFYYDCRAYLMTAHILYRFWEKDTAPFWCVLHHYKFLQGDLERYRDRIAQKNFGFQSGNYKTIMQFYDTQPDISLIYEGTRQYTDSQSLTCLPLDPIPWSN